MDHATVLENLKSLHREIETDDGKDANAVGDDVFPLDGLSGFDSLLIPNVIRGLAKALGLPLPIRGSLAKSVRGFRREDQAPAP